MGSDTFGERVLQREEHRVVTLEKGGTTVRKTFLGADPDLLVALAAREHDRLSRFSVALAGIAGAQCPTPLELSGPPHPSVTMTRAEGQPLSERLGRPVDEQEADWLAKVLSDGLSAYVDTFGEPYYDFHFRNMLYDVGRRQITFLDFGVPDHLLPVRSELDRLPPFDASLGNLYGSSLFEAVRPKNVHRVRQNRCRVVLASSVIEALLNRSASPVAAQLPTRDGLRQATALVYRQSTSWGPPSHHLWYRLFPLRLARGRQRLDQLFAGPRLKRQLPTSE